MTEDPADISHPTILLIGSANAAHNELLRLLENWQFTVTTAADPAEATLDPKDMPSCVILDLPEGPGEVERGLAWLDRLATATGLPLPALLIGNGPAPELAEPPGGGLRLWLRRPFRPARLRALLDRLLASHETAR